jgi:Uma2 family endonuclease
MATKTRVSLEEFLAMPETEPAWELIDGEVTQKFGSCLYEARVITELICLLGNYLEGTREGLVAPNVAHLYASEERVFLPDLIVTLKGRIPNDRRMRLYGPIPVQPDLAIEVLSPGESTGRTLERADFYMRAGTQLLWLVDPEIECITVYRPNEAPTIHRAPSTIDAKPVLRDFALDLAALFGALHEDEE